MKKFPIRIQRDIETIPFPVIKEVVSTYIWGNIGSGKTIQAVFMMLNELRNKGQALFTSVLELLLEFKNLYSNKEEETTELNLVEKYSEIHLLVLDDFGVERTTDWSFQLLYIIINRRYENMRKTIITSNFNLEQLAEKLGDDRIPSRIQQMCKIIKLPNKNYRERK